MFFAVSNLIFPIRIIFHEPFRFAPDLTFAEHLANPAMQDADTSLKMRCKTKRANFKSPQKFLKFIAACDLSRIKTAVCNRRMDRAARLQVYQGEAEGPVSAEAPPWQGVKMLVAA